MPFDESACLYSQQCVTHPAYNTVEYVPKPGKEQELEQALLLYRFPVNERDRQKKTRNKCVSKKELDYKASGKNAVRSIACKPVKKK